MKPILTSLLLLNLLTGCMLMPHYETVAGKVNGRVIDATGKPVSGAKIDYHLHGGRKLGATTSAQSGDFELGPFRQWFYLIYIGSPGVCPVPYTLLSDFTLPDALSVTYDGATAVYCLGTKEDHQERQRHYSEPQRERLAKLRWAGRSSRPVLVITPAMRDQLPRRREFNSPVIPPRNIP